MRPIRLALGLTLSTLLLVSAAQAQQADGTAVDSPGVEGIGDTFLGSSAGYRNLNGYYDTFIGALAGFSNVDANNNTFLGSNAGVRNVTGNENTFVGADAGLATQTGSNNIAIGYNAAFQANLGNGNIYIGNYGQSENNTIRMGESQVRTFISGIFNANVGSSWSPVYINSKGQLGTRHDDGGGELSALRFKDQVHDIGHSTDELMKLRPVTFHYKPEYGDGAHILQYGLIAEEVAKVYPELATYDTEGRPYSVRYLYLSAMLLNEVQKQHHRAKEQAEVVAVQQKQIESQQGEIEELRRQLQLQNTAMQERLSRLEKLAGTLVQSGD